jgi:hypothetical protein
MTTETPLKPCQCGTIYAPQLRPTRIPGTFKAIAYVYFCMGGCHREAFGNTPEQAAENWNATFNNTNTGENP